MSRAIYEDDVIKLLDKKWKLGQYPLPRDVRALPSAEPKPKKGKWMPENRTMDAFWVCSACKFPSEAHAANILYNYCPNCGADMRG